MKKTLTFSIFCTLYICLVQLLRAGLQAGMGHASSAGEFFDLFSFVLLYLPILLAAARVIRQQSLQSAGHLISAFIRKHWVKIALYIPALIFIWSNSFAGYNCIALFTGGQVAVHSHLLLIFYTCLFDSGITFGAVALMPLLFCLIEKSSTGRMAAVHP